MTEYLIYSPPINGPLGLLPEDYQIVTTRAQIAAAVAMCGQHVDDPISWAIYEARTYAEMTDPE